MSVATRIAESAAPPAGAATAEVDPRALRQACGQFLTGVTVVTSTDGEYPFGMTANSFTSVSLDPPMVLFCPHKDAKIRELIDQSGCFAINVLSEDQAELSRRFTHRVTVCFGDIPTRIGVSGAPLLDDALTYLDCRVVREIAAGDHTIVLGEVLDVGRTEPGARPLAFFRGQYVGLA
ncbi:3-hydroxy-9,10-secoandrosta-1,3,5(10)-triene-9,17-dione monooxygenase reductase component [Catenulispora sp. GAS73]|uniref:flavin reductase family protein n=1 Tax=Catenulispora sp. GAS73 TaxID=3156269 RepID=UPI003511C64C